MILDVIGIILCMLVTFILSFLAGAYASLESRKASHFFATAWLISTVGFGGTLYMTLKLFL